jgi:predicted ATPase
MRFSRIEAENLKGFRTTQGIDLKPITLLFGSNNAGRRTILQALYCLWHIPECRNVHLDQTSLGRWLSSDHEHV